MDTDGIMNGAKLAKKQSMLSLSGKTFVRENQLDKVYFEGNHCSGCRVLTLKY